MVNDNKPEITIPHFDEFMQLFNLLKMKWNVEEDIKDVTNVLKSAKPIDYIDNPEYIISANNCHMALKQNQKQINKGILIHNN